MQWPAGASVVAALLVVLGGLAGPVAAASVVPQSPTSTGGVTDTAAANHTPTDPETDVIGWEHGYWYNETLPITEDDGLNESELGAVVNRSMARVEYIRQLEFNRTVPVEVISRETYRAEYVDTNNTTTALRTFDNVKFEALFLIGEDRDSLEVQQSNRGSNVLGFYSPRDDRIVIVSESETPRITETTLGHELVHALQFGQFNTSEFNSSTRELHNARNGVIEGDARYVDQKYGELCEAEWNCTSQPPSEGGGGDLHLGVYIMKYFPYSDGPGFIELVREEGGWAAVNELYTSPPESAEQVIRPEKYREDAPTSVDLPDRSTDAWSRVTPADRAPYGSVGQASITAMFAYPAYDESRDAQPVVAPREFLNINPDGSVDSADPINYDIDYASGWDGDKLWVYENDAGETAYTWRIVWDTEADAAEFADGYRRLLEYWGGQPVDGYEGVWRIPEGESGFADVFHVHVEGDTVTIVNAPTREQLNEVQSGALVTPSPTTSHTPTPRPPVTTAPSANPTTSPGQPGFGVVAALAGLSAGLLWWRRD